MAEPAKYLFDRSFEQPFKGTERGSDALERRLRENFQADLAAARVAALAEGREAGSRAAMDSLEARMANTLDAMLARATAMSKEIAENCHRNRANAIETGVAVAETLALELVRRQPLADLEALFNECLEYASHAPHLAIRVNDALADEVRLKISKLAQLRGFAGEIMVLGDPELPAGDATLEWADGGVARDVAATRARIGDKVRRFLETQAAELAQPHTTSNRAHLPATNESGDGS